MLRGVSRNLKKLNIMHQAIVVERKSDAYASSVTRVDFPENGTLPGMINHPKRDFDILTLYLATLRNPF